MDKVNERSSAVLSGSFRTSRNRLQAPTAITYRIDDLASGQQIRAWTAVDPAPEIEILLTSTDNRIVDQGAAQEERLVTMVAAYGDSEVDQVTGECRYVVINLRKVN